MRSFDAVAMSDMADRIAARFSGRQRARMLHAVTRGRGPSVLVIDDPAADLDLLLHGKLRQMLLAKQVRPSTLSPALWDGRELRPNRMR
jgi:ABC-type sulfate/molybdate transport systems ATPase subunit